MYSNIHSRKARARSSSCTLFDDHSPLRILSKTVSGPAPSFSDDLYSAAAAFALLTSSDIVSLSVELNSLVPMLLPWMIFLVRDELAVKEGVKPAAYPKSRGDVASNRGMNFPLIAIKVKVRGEIKEETRNVNMEEHTEHITRVATYQTYNTPLAHEYSSFLPHQHQSISLHPPPPKKKKDTRHVECLLINVMAY